MMANVNKNAKGNSREGGAELANIESNEVDYIPYLTDSTPWFISKHSSASCIVDLPNIEHIAFGTQYAVIELWELRNDTQALTTDKKSFDSHTDEKKRKSQKEALAAR